MEIVTNEFIQPSKIGIRKGKNAGEDTIKG